MIPMKKRRATNLIFMLIILTAMLLFSSGIQLFLHGEAFATTIHFLMGIVLFLGCLEWFRSTHLNGS